MNIALEFFGLSLLLPLVAVPAGWGLGVLMRMARIAANARRWRQRSVIIAEYEAPDNLKPAEIAFLYDRTFGEEELLATLFDLELRQMVSLKAVKGSREADFTITLRCKGTETGLEPFEQELLLSIKVQRTPTWRLLKTDSSIWDSDIETIMESSLRQKGYFWYPSKNKRWAIFWLYGLALALVTIVLPVGISEGWFTTVTPVVHDPYSSLSQQLAIIVVGIVALFAGGMYALAVYYAYAAYSRGMDLERGTNRLVALWPYLEGFKEYLRVVEQARLEFENETLKEKARARVLPYAVALNLPTAWQARFSKS